jgi:hypothetical protein
MLELLDCIKLTAVQWLQLLVSLQDVSSTAAATVHSAQHAETAVSTAVALAAPLLTIVCSERAQHTVSLQQQQQQLGTTSATLTSTLPAATAIAAAATTATPTSAQHHDKNLALVVGFLLTALELAWGKTNVYKLVQLLLDLTVRPGGVSLEYLLQHGYRTGYAKWQSAAVTDITNSSGSSSSVKAVQTLSDFSVQRVDAGEDQVTATT